MNTFSHVWVFSALASGEQIHAFVQHDAEGETARQLGANHIWHLRGKPDDCMVEDYAGVMAQTIRQQGDSGLVLLPNTRRGKLLAAKLGFRLAAAVSNDASAVTQQVRPLARNWRVLVRWRKTKNGWSTSVMSASPT